MLVDEEDIMFEACVEMWFKSKLHDDWVVMAVDVRIYSVQALEDLTYKRGEGFGEWNA